jgi:hypothetical protein
MESPVKTLESIIKRKQVELALITIEGWQIYRRHEKGGENPLESITINRRNELQTDIRDLEAVVDAIRPQPPVQVQTVKQR